MKFSDNLKKLDRYPFHMPGHKRKSKFGIYGSDIDITEIDEADNLHCPKGNILDIENALSKIYSSKKTFLGVNGSTGCIIAAVFAVFNEGDKAIVARNCHKSVFSACMLRHLKIVCIEPKFDYIDGYYTNVIQSDADKIISENPDAKGIIITSPTYEGNISRIKCKIPLIVDAAHGAHFGISNFPEYPHGDIVISSLHKTLPSLTQTAAANIYNERYIQKYKFYNDIFETSSPSYVLMDSVAKCCDYIKNNKKDFENYIRCLWDFRDIELHALRLKYSDDISKIVISTANADITAQQLAERLRHEYSIECEMTSKSYIILMTSVADEKSDLEYLKNALCEIDSSLLTKANELSEKPRFACNTVEISIYDKFEKTPLSNCEGKTSNEFVYAYPPDIPIVMPGEKITSNIICYINELIASGVNVISDSGSLPDNILTKRKE